MRKLFSTFILLSTLAISMNAKCVYQKAIIGQEFPIGVMLTWSTATEENSSMFMLEKSENGVDFTNIGSVQAIGNSFKTKDYNFLDVMAASEKIYYRLKLIDTDGAFSYSDVLSVRKKFANNFMVARMSSATTSKEFNVTLDAFKEGEIAYEVRSLQGEVFFAGKQPVINGLNDVAINMADFKPNIYRVVFIMAQEEESLVIQKVQDEAERKQNMASSRKGMDGKQ
jgi:hypothetical protein